MIIRRAVVKDIPQMVRLLEELFVIEEDFSVDPYKQELGLSLLVKDEKNGFILVAESEDSQVIGMCSVQFLISTAEGGRVGLLEDLIIEKDQRGKGIGRLLIDAVCAQAKKSGCIRIQLLADKNNSEAIKFYEKTGFSFTQLIALRKKIFFD